MSVGAGTRPNDALTDTLRGSLKPSFIIHAPNQCQRPKRAVNKRRS